MPYIFKVHNYSKKYIVIIPRNCRCVSAKIKLVKNLFPQYLSARDLKLSSSAAEVESSVLQKSFLVRLQISRRELA